MPRSGDLREKCNYEHPISTVGKLMLSVGKLQPVLNLFNPQRRWKHKR